MGDYVYFFADDGIHGRELWRASRTSAEAELYQDIWTGSEGSKPFGSSSDEGREVFIPLGGQLLFTAETEAEGAELWVLSGEATGATMLVVRPGPEDSTSSSSNVNGAVIKGDRLVFRARDDEHGSELWVTDGSPTGTSLLKDINPGDEGSSISRITVNDPFAYFRANDGVQFELWQTDGTVDGTMLVLNVMPGPSSGFPSGLTPNDDVLYFEAHPVAPNRLWRYDVAIDDLTFLETTPPLDATFGPAIVGVGGDWLYFMYFAGVIPEEPTSGHFFRVPVDFDEPPESVTSFSLGIFSTLDYELDVNQRGQFITATGPGNHLVGEYQGYFYFTAETEQDGKEVRRVRLPDSDYLDMGRDLLPISELVADINPGEASSDPVFLGATADALYFAADDGVHGREIWVVPLGPPGDVNGDGATDLADFGVLKGHFGSSDARWREGDLNGDGRIDLHDFSILKRDFGAGVAEPAAVAPAPAAPSPDVSFAAAAAIAAVFGELDDEDAA